MRQERWRRRDRSTILILDRPGWPGRSTSGSRSDKRQDLDHALERRLVLPRACRLTPDILCLRQPRVPRGCVRATPSNTIGCKVGVLGQFPCHAPTNWLQDSARFADQRKAPVETLLEFCSEVTSFRSKRGLAQYALVSGRSYGDQRHRDIREVLDSFDVITCVLGKVVE